MLVWVRFVVELPVQGVSLSVDHEISLRNSLVRYDMQHHTAVSSKAPCRR
jgi:hypothetical protein